MNGCSYFLFFVKHDLKANFMLSINILGTESTKDLNNMISVHQSSQANERIDFFLGEGLAWVVQCNSHCSLYQEEIHALIN